MKTKLALLPFFLCIYLAFPAVASAVPPPDFIFNIGSQLAYVFSFVAVFFSAVMGVAYQYIQVKYRALRVKPWKFFILLLLLAGLSIGVVYLYAQHRQKVAYEAWLQASETVEEEVSSDEALSISNEDFQAVLDSGRTDFTVLDARENLEYSYGFFPGSLHLRYADLLQGLTEELPLNEHIYVLCWSGLRGEEVAQLLRSYGYSATYLVSGAEGWVSDFGGLWEGEIKFSSVYPDQEFGLTYSTEQVREKVQEGAILVDAREPEKIAEFSLDAYAMPLMYTPSSDLEAMYAQIPPASTVITVCDAYINCFMAKLVGVELALRGHNFLGRYNSPWEY